MFKGNKILIVTLSALILGLSGFKAGGQDIDALGSYSPYSVFGVGRMAYDGTAYNQAMGGIGIGMRDNGYINYTNPAAITARDTLAFMLDFGLNQQNLYTNDNVTKAAYNVFNMQNVALTFPIYKKSAFIVGIAPFRYQLFFGGAVMLFDRISIGAEGIYYFGYINKHNDILFNSSSLYNTISTGWDYKVHCFSGKFGLQYIQPIARNNSQIVIGGTYRIGNSLKGDVAKYAFSAADTVLYDGKGHASMDIADEFGVGVSYRVNDKWAVGVDFIQQNWHGSSFPDNSMWTNFSTENARYYRAGFEITPNMYDIRYYMKRVTYRAGAYYEESYVKVNGHQVNSFGITFGASFPIYRWHNAVSVAVDIGQRGTLRHHSQYKPSRPLVCQIQI